MFKSLMFKTNPLAQELSRYKQKHLSQGKTLISKNKKSYGKIDNKNSQQKQFLYLSPKIIPKYPHSILKRSLNQSVQHRQFHSPQQIKKSAFKIHNHSLRNDNFLKRSISPEDVDTLKLTKRYSLKQKQQNFQQLQFPKNGRQKNQNNDFMHYSVNPSRERKKYKKNNLFTSEKYDDQHVSFSQTKKSHQIKTMTTQNELKSTLYQSIDLGNIFQKIESKIDLSKTISLHDKKPLQKEVFRGAKQNCLTERNPKEVKIIEKLRGQLSSQTSKKSSQIMNQFNIKSLIQKKLQNQRYQQFPKTPQPESLTSRETYFPQPTDIDTLINSLNFKDSSQKTWMPSTRKKSSVIVIDEKGNIIEDDPMSKLKKNQQQKMKMSSKIAKLREVMKAQQMSEKK